MLNSTKLDDLWRLYVLQYVILITQVHRFGIPYNCRTIIFVDRQRVTPPHCSAVLLIQSSMDDNEECVLLKQKDNNVSPTIAPVSENTYLEASGDDRNCSDSRRSSLEEDMCYCNGSNGR